MNLLLVLPILIPLLTGVAAFLLRSSRLLQRGLGMTGSLALLGSALALLQAVVREGVVATEIGNWPAPFGITLVADRLSAVMVLLAAVMGAAVALYSLATIDRRREAGGYWAFYHFLLMGVCGAFLTGDIFNLYVWFEVMLMASFVLMTLGGRRTQLEGGIKYVLLSMVSSFFFLTAVGILYGTVGTLNMADLALRIPGAPSATTSAAAILFLAAFGIKSALFPLFFWLPASYHTPPVAVSALFAGLLTKVGVYALIRVFTLLFVGDVPYTHSLILLLSGLTMVTGVLGAVAHEEFRRILSFHIISQVGYMVMGLGLFTPLALAGSIFYIVHHIIVKTNLFLASGVARRLGGTYELAGLQGLYRSAPGLSLLFLLSAFSLAGVPPLSGFWAKLILLRAALDAESYLITAVALVVGLLTLFSMTKIWGKGFWPADAPAGEPPPLGFRERFALYLPMAVLALMTLGIGVFAEPLFAFSVRAAEDLLDPSAYIETVLGGTR